MRKQQLRFDPGLVMALLFAGVAAWPLLTRPSLPTFTDAQHHIYRVYELIAAWRAGVPYTRWATDLYYTYGYPVFNFYAPFSHYVAAAYGLVFGPVAGVKFALVLSELLGAAGVYLFARRQWGPLPAVVSAAVYAWAPYISLSNPIVRGALPEAFAVGLGPIVLWAFAGLTATRSRAFFLTAAVSLACALMSHNLASFMIVGLTAGWVGWEFLVIRRPTTWAGWRSAIAWPLSAGLLAVALAAVMWLPAALERNTVQFGNAFRIVTARRYERFDEVLAPATSADAQAVDAAEYPFKAGLPQWILGLAGVLTMLWAGPRRRTTLFFALAAGACLFIIVPQSEPLWRAVPVLAYLQFSYRLLGVLVPCLAWLAAAAVDWAGPAANRRTALAFGLASVCALAALPYLNPRPWPDFGPVTRQSLVAFDLFGLRGVGTTNDGEFLPVTVLAKPQPNPEAIAAVQVDAVEKIDRAALPADAEVTLTDHTPLRDAFTITAAQAFTLKVLTFYWPGWTAYLDGVRVPVEVTQPDGLMAVAVPAGAHTLRMQLVDTPPRQAGWLISGLALCAVVGIAFWRRWPARTPEPAVALTACPAAAFAALAVALVAGGLVAKAVLQYQATHTVPVVAGAQVERFTRFNNGMALVAYNFYPTTARSGEKFDITFYWEVVEVREQPASVFVHVYGPDGALCGQADKPDPVEFFPTTRWALGRVTEDIETVTLKPDAPPGIYTVAVGMWDRASGQRSPILDEAGQPTAADKLTLTTTFEIKP